MRKLRTVRSVTQLFSAVCIDVIFCVTLVAVVVATVWTRKPLQTVGTCAGGSLV